MNLERWNKWWIEKAVEPKLLGKRRGFFQDLLPYFEKRQIVVIKGIRRVGKTTLMYQFIDYLIREKHIDPYQILYFSFDEEVQEIDEIIEQYEIKVLKKRMADFDRIYIFLDEVQKLKNWSDKIKILYDLNPNLKVFITGSSSLDIEKGSKESLAGRSFEFLLSPLSFKEYLEFKNFSFDADRIDIFRRELELKLSHYMLTSGFIELVNEEDERFLSSYCLNSIIDRITFIDIPQIFRIEEPELLSKILKIISSRPGMILDYRTLSSDLMRDHRTIENYITFLKSSMLINILYNYSGNFMSSDRKLKKFYPSITSIPLLLFPEKRNDEAFYSYVVENLVVSSLKANFFYRSPDKKEVDIILQDKNPIPLEIKYRDKINEKDLAGLLSFLDRFKIRSGFIITKNINEERLIKKKKVKFIPLIDFLLSEKFAKKMQKF
jgi:hypothetical protein